MFNPSNRRKFWRAAFRSPARLATPKGNLSAKILDISLKGAMVEVPEGQAGEVGEHCRLRIDLSDSAIIIMVATIAHETFNGRYLGLRCETIDLDSMTHLRRLVALNAGDPEILERDLHQLIAD